MVHTAHGHGSRIKPSPVTPVLDAPASRVYSIAYDDGDRDADLREEFVRSLDGAAPVMPEGGFSEGDRVWARFRGRGSWFPGRVAIVSSSSAGRMYSIAYDDGDRDDGLREEFVSSQAAPMPVVSSAQAPFAVGDLVVVRADVGEF